MTTIKDKNSGRVVSLDEIVQKRPTFGKTVLIGGVFDILHPGHIEHMRDAKSLGDTLIVHVTSDARVRKKKGPTRPIQNEAARASIVSAIRYVDYVFIHDLPHYTPALITEIKPDILYLNEEAVSADILSQLQNLDKEVTVVISNLAKKTSTSSIVDKISQR